MNTLCDEAPSLETIVSAVDAAIDSILNAIISDGRVARLASAWRSLAFATNRFDIENEIRWEANELEFLQCTFEEFIDDLSSGDESLPRRGIEKILRHAIESNGTAYCIVCVHGRVENTREHLTALRELAEVCARWNAVAFVDGASSLVGLHGWEALSPSLNVREHLAESHSMTLWDLLRGYESTQHLGVVVPFFRWNPPLTAPREAALKKLEDATSDLSASALLVQRCAVAFSQNRVATNIIGRDGKVLGPTTSQRLSESQQEALGTHGLIASIDGCFVAAPSVRRPLSGASTPEEKAREINYRLNSEIPYRLYTQRYT